MNKTNYKKVLKQIKDNPKCWKQDSWHCNTSHCFAGWSQIMLGQKPDDDTARRDGRIFLDISARQAAYLFAPERTMEDFEHVLEGGEYFLNGYNRDGYDKEGFDFDGLDKNYKPRKENKKV